MFLNGRITRPSPTCAQMNEVFGCARNLREQRREVRRLLARLGKRRVGIAVNEHDEPDLAGEVEQSIERGVGDARRFTGDLRGHELLVDRELADPDEHAGERLEDATHVIGRVHVRRIETGDHRIEPRLLRLG